MTIDNNDTARPTSGGAGEFKTNVPTIVSLLYLVGFVAGITSIVGIVIAYLKRSEVAGTWAESHLTYLIRTFWFGLLTAIVGFILARSEEHTSELQSLMRISYAVFCLKKKKKQS